jgi:RNA polymerase-binding protein DksA
MAQISRYSDVELAEFKAYIEEKLDRAKKYLIEISEQILDARENKDSEGDWMDDTSSTTDLEMLFTMEGRQRKQVYDLESALVRIHNKSYGICVVTGTLIDKRRLMAVPTTTKSVEAKLNADLIQEPKPEKPKPAPRKKEGPNQIITKIIKKKSSNAKPAKSVDMDDDDLLDDTFFGGLDSGLDDGVDVDDTIEDDMDSGRGGDSGGDDDDFDFDSVASDEGYDED